MTPRPLASLLAVLLAAAPAPADDWAAFVAEYGPHHDKITAHLWRNVKVDFVRKQYEVMPGAGRGPYISTVQVSAVGGADRLLYRSTVSNVSPSHPSKPLPGAVYEFGGLLTPDAGCEFKKTGDIFTLSPVARPWHKKGSPDYFAEFEAWRAGLSWPLYAAYIERGPNRYRPALYFDRNSVVVSRGTFRGQAVVSVFRIRNKWTGGHLETTVHLRQPDYLAVGSDEVVIGPGNAPVGKEVITIDYGPPQPDTGLPFPTRVTGTYTDPRKPDAVSEDVTFTEYKRYTPTADELDPVKQFGVAMPPAEPRPPLPTQAEWADMLRLPAPPPPTPEPAGPVAPPPALAWRHPELTAGLALIVCVVLAAVAYRRLRV